MRSQGPTTAAGRALLAFGGRATVAAALVAWMSAIGAAQQAARVGREPLRPQFHFTARENWLNDPNGLVYFENEYHLFFQHNPHGTEWGHMTWGHAVSPDLVHWRQLEHALHPDELGTMFSGSAVVDWQNVAGFQAGDAPALVALYTAAGGQSPASAGRPFTQCLAFSNDRGRTWTKYAKNPVVEHIAGENRDPKVFWHEPTQRWVTALYLEEDRFAILTSPDLKEWSQASEVRVPGSIECPDLFELPIEGESGAAKWIFWTANNAYLVGEFDGARFVAETGPVRSEFGANCFAAQSFSDIPAEDGRRIQIAWMRGGQYPGMPFNQQMSLPTVVTLRRTGDGLRLYRRPVAELAHLRGEGGRWSGVLRDGANPLGDIAGDAYEVEATIEPGSAREIVFSIRGTRLAYDVAEQTLALGDSRAAAPLVDGKLQLTFFVDRTSIEVFASEGRSTITQCFLPSGEDLGVSLTGVGAVVQVLQWWPLQSIWQDAAE